MITTRERFRMLSLIEQTTTIGHKIRDVHEREELGI